MPRPSTHPFWIHHIRTLIANTAHISPAEVRRRLEKFTKQDDAPTPVPSDRSIRRIIRDFRGASEKARQPYRYFAWPESMQAGAVPWEAARVILDLMRLRIDEKMEPPLVAEAQWFWRVTQAIPDASIQLRAQVASFLVMADMSAEQPQTESLRALQWRLAYQPWRSKEDKAAYIRAVEEGRIPKDAPSSPSIGLEDAIQLFGHIFQTQDLEIITLGSTFKKSSPTQDPKTKE